MSFKKDNSLLTGRLKSIVFAYQGAKKLITTEHSIMVQTALAVIMIIAGFFFGISKEEWMFQIFAIGLVLATEGLNTAIEKLSDFVHSDFHERIGFIKDISAGAVFFAAITAIVIGLLIYLPIFL